MPDRGSIDHHPASRFGGCCIFLFGVELAGSGQGKHCRRSDWIGMAYASARVLSCRYGLCLGY